MSIDTSLGDARKELEDARKDLGDLGRMLREECLLHPGLDAQPKIKAAWARLGAAHMELDARAAEVGARADGQPEANFRTGPTTGALPTFREDGKPDADVVEDAPGAWAERHRNDWKGDGGKKKDAPKDEDEGDDEADPDADEVDDAKRKMVDKMKGDWKPRKDGDAGNPCPPNVTPDPARANVTAEMADDEVEQAKAKALEKSKARWKENPAHGPNDPYKGR